MTETKGKVRDLDKELADLDHEISRLEAEEAALPPVPTWDELQSRGAIQELQEQQAKRGILPDLLRAVRIKRLEVRREKEQGEIAPLRKRQEKAYEAMQEATAEKYRVEEALGAARAEHSDATVRLQSRETKIKQIERELRQLRGEE